MIFSGLNRKQKKNFNKFLGNARQLFTEGELFSNNVVSWYLREGKMTFDFDDAGQPTIECSEGSLVCLSKGDSIQIDQVVGTYAIMSTTFSGEQGKVEWNRTTYAGEMYAQLTNFSISMTDDDVKSDEAKLTSSLFSEEMIGTIELRPKKASSDKERTYPRFESRIGRIQLRDIFDGISYEGGVEIRGSSLSGKSSSGKWATLTFQHQDSTLIRVWSAQILFQNGVIDAPHARMSIDLGEDSICHPDIRVRYLDSEKLFRRRDNWMALDNNHLWTPYHRLEFDVEAVEWVIGQPDVVFRRLTGNRPEPAVFREC